MIPIVTPNETASVDAVGTVVSDVADALPASIAAILPP